MKRNVVISFFCIMLLCNATSAQTINLSDSLYHVLRHKPVPTAKFETRNSFITGNSAKVFSIKAGLSFRKTLTIGIGYNWIGTELKESILIDNRIYVGDIKLRYIAPFLEYSFYKKGLWEATVPVQFGFGRSYIQYQSRTDKEQIRSGRVVLYEPSMTVEYKFFNVVGVGGGLGYRIMLKNNKEINQQFTSPVYVLRIRLIFDEIYRRAKIYRAQKMKE